MVVFFFYVLTGLEYVLNCYAKEKKCNFENTVVKKSESSINKAEINGLVEGLFYTTSLNVHLHGFVSLQQFLVLAILARIC